MRGLITAAALLAFAGWEPARSHRSASQAVEAARAADMGGALALGLAVRAWSGAVAGLSRSEQVEDDVEEAVQHARGCGDAATHAFVLAFAGGVRVLSGSIDAVCRLYEQAIEVCEADDLAFQLPVVHANLGLWPVLSGRLDWTRHHAHRGVELARPLGRPGWEALGLAGLGAAAVLQGDHGRAEGWLSEAQEVLGRHGLEGTPYDRLLRPWLALAAYASGDLDAARATAEGIVRIGSGSGSRWDEAVGEWLLGMLALAGERDDKARAHLEASRALSTNPRLPWTQGRSLLGLAQLAMDDEGLEDAWKLAHEGLEVLVGYGDRVGTAAALEQVADLTGALGEPERSLRLLAASERFHTDTGIVRFPTQADRFDRARGRAHAELDSRDALVAQGHTNAEIGERLFISVNTVKTHLSRVYAKIDVDGRANLAAEVARRDL